MRSFFKTFFASLLALVIFSILGFVLLIIFVSVMASSEKPAVAAKSVLVLDLTKEYREQEQEDPIGSFTGNAENNVPGLFQMVRMIEHAKTDDKISGIYIKCIDNVNGFATSDELRNALTDFKTSKKFVIAYGDLISQKGYYVGSIADKIYCNPKGLVDWRGLAATLFFVKGTLEKLEIEPQIFYAGKFKSATEPLREKKMTEANKLQTLVYVNDIYSRMLLAASQKSGLDTATLHNLANTAAIQTADDALKHKLVDGLKYDDDVKGEIIQMLKLERRDKINFLSFAKYAKSIDFSKKGTDRLAVIFAEGDIVDGKGEDGQVGSETFKNLIRKARLDKNIKAIVLRVNSPGGSALASEVIWHEVTIARKAKPVVVSFGDVAASGGYYIACNADSIFAQPNSITGSIGVFGIVPNMQKFFESKLGVTFDGVKTGQYADMMSVHRPLTPAEKTIVQNSVDTIYHSFKSRVAEGRKLSMQVVDSIAQGRVWTGSHALQVGLVDRIGSLKDAINCAARLAKISDYNLRTYPEKKTFIQELLQQEKTEVAVNMISQEIGEDQYKLLKHLKQVKQMFGIPQAKLPFSMYLN
ncbi:signal peptide peptidase SppA [Aridibaculum aurantiacum]|uniref:signal peptide peptidase SppA n=1 Tax=Aridibaculum aurantiacum TaxID=2810307 RepID=UPI001A971263|nr:signal peptide peptidase SppA [Aridibaculum aurantiacum]